MTDLKYKSIKGVKWTTVSTIFVALTQFAYIAILVRLLSKNDFGLMAIVMVVKGFADLFADFGISVAILHYRQITTNEYSSLYWLNVIIGIGIYIIICLLSPLITNFYNQEILLKLIPITCLVIPFSSFGNLCRTYLQKFFYFKIISLVNILSSVVFLISGIFFAYYGYGVYALVISNLLKYCFSSFAYFFVTKKYLSIRFHLSFFETIRFLKIGGYNTLAQVMNFFTNSFDVLIVAKVLGTDTVGAYTLAKELVKKPAAILENILLKVSIPIFSEIQNDSIKSRKIFLFMQKIICTSNGLVYLGIFTLAFPIVCLYYGKQYAQYAPIVQILAIYYFLIEYHNTMDTFTLAMGRTDIDVKWNFLRLITVPLAIYIGTGISLYFVVIFMMFAYILLIYPNWIMYPRKLLNISFFVYYKTFFKTLILFTIPALCSLGIINFVKVSYLTLFFISSVVFCILLFLMYIIFEKELLKTIFLKIKKS